VVFGIHTFEGESPNLEKDSPIDQAGCGTCKEPSVRQAVE
jgi:hypothetical protein